MEVDDVNIMRYNRRLRMCACAQGFRRGERAAKKKNERPPVDMMHDLCRAKKGSQGWE